MKIVYMLNFIHFNSALWLITLVFKNGRLYSVSGRN